MVIPNLADHFFSQLSTNHIHKTGVTMKNQTLLFAIFCMLFSSCDQNNTNQDVFSLEIGSVLVLCEGNFNANNASLWAFTPGKEDITGPLFQDLTGRELGDVAQSFLTDGDRLYIVNNNSHTLEIINLKSPLTHEGTVGLPNTSPRYMAIQDNTGYITCWNVEGILVVDLNDQTVLDTIPLGALPEDILIIDDFLYTSLTMDNTWNPANYVLKIALSNQSVVDTFQVVPGPGRLLSLNGQLYVASNSLIFDGANYESRAGTSTIDLQSGTVISNDYGATSQVGTDWVVVNGVPYRATLSGMAPLNADLSLDLEHQIGNFTGVYSIGAYQDYLFFGVTDYVAPDQVVVTDPVGNELVTFDVGALPTDFAVVGSDDGR
jgi:hypothetical protein